jgi:hypothetical protein
VGIAKHPKEAEIFFLRAISAGHIPAVWMLCLFYMRGESLVRQTIIGCSSITLRLVICLDCQSVYDFFNTNI